ncbi:type II secretion system ATPase GspE [bacterium]|nr:type II secretion system ATPase GspE [bacterium]
MEDKQFNLEEAKIDQQLFYRIPYKYLEENKLIPICEPEPGTVQIAMADLDDIVVIDEVERILNSKLIIEEVPEDVLLKKIEQCHSGDAQSVEKVIQDLTEEDLEIIGHIREDQDGVDVANEAPIIKLVNLIIWNALQMRASDIHIEPFENQLLVRYRVDGVLHESSSPPSNLHAAIISRIKIMADLDISERRTTQDGRIQIKLGSREIDIRVSIMPTVWGENVVMRLLDKTALMLDLTDLGFDPEMLKTYTEIINSAHGIVLITGPTGSGKTTTLYSSLSLLNTQDVKIITIEDPVEYQISGINQIHVNPKVGLTFASGLRSILRQDPDKVMVGEIRDLETAETAVQASLTGHLVFSTLHTNDAPSAVTRLIDMGVEPYLITSSVIGIIAQRLVRVLCPNCKEAYETDVEEYIERLMLPEDSVKKGKQIYYKPVGCEECRGTGYKGRISLFELMLTTEEIKKLTLERSASYEIKKQAVKDGMITLQQDGWKKACAGITTIEEVLRVTEEA